MLKVLTQLVIIIIIKVKHSLYDEPNQIGRNDAT